MKKCKAFFSTKLLLLPQGSRKQEKKNFLIKNPFSMCCYWIQLFGHSNRLKLEAANSIQPNGEATTNCSAHIAILLRSSLSWKLIRFFCSLSWEGQTFDRVFCSIVFCAEKEGFHLKGLVFVTEPEFNRCPFEDSYLNFLLIFKLKCLQKKH